MPTGTATPQNVVRNYFKSLYNALSLSFNPFLFLCISVQYVMYKIIIFIVLFCVCLNAFYEGSQKSCQIWYSAYSRTLGRDFLDLKYSDWNILFFNISTWDWHTELTKDTDIMQHKNRIFCVFFCNLYRKISILSKIWWCFSLWNFPGKESHLAAIKNNMYLV